MLPDEPAIQSKDAKKLFNLFQELRKSNHNAVKAKTNHDKPTVIIVGAGLSGISAAKELVHHGFYVILLEARDRIGGRIHSHHLGNGKYVELGAQFLHGIKENPLLRICDTYNIELKPYSRSQWSVYDKDGREINKDDLKELMDEYKRNVESLSQQRLSDTKDRFLARDLKEFAELLARIPPSDPRKNLSTIGKMVSLHQLQEESLFAYKTALDKKESESNFLVTNGYIKILDGMLQDATKENKLEMHLNSDVFKIQHTSDEVIVSCKNGETYTGDAIICTLPLGVLQSGNVHFEPHLSQDKLKAIKKLGCAVHNKVILEFQEPFWGNQSHYLIPSYPDMKAWIDIVNLRFFTDKVMPVLICSIHTSMDLNTLPDNVVIDHLVKLIKNIHPASFKPLRYAWLTHWEKDPYALCSYSYHPKGSTPDDNSEVARPAGRLIFAGEHTSRSPGNVQSAYISGLEASKQIVEQLYFIYKTLT